MSNATTTIQLKNFKEAGGEETLRFEASLYINGKKTAIVSNDGTGGDHRYYFQAPALKEQFDQFVTDLKTAELQPKQNRLHHHLFEYLAEMRSVIPNYAQARIDRDMVIDCLITNLQEQKQFKKWCKKGTVFRLSSDPKGDYRDIAQPYSDRIKTFLINKYGEDNLEIVNELIKKD